MDPPLLEFAGVMRRLRAECAWKREQTHRSLARYLLEETHETLEVLEHEPLDDEHLAEELGDLLLQVYFHAAIAEERGAFTLDDVARGIIAKMVRRNPHVFGTAEQRATTGDAAAVNEAWEAVKAEERRGATRDPGPDALPASLPALLMAAKVLERRARAGLTPVEPGPELGDRLLALVAEANAAGADPEQLLRDAVRRLP